MTNNGEIDPELLNQVPPEKRADFKRFVRFQRYISSRLFGLVWNMCLFYFITLFVGFLDWLIPWPADFWQGLSGDLKVRALILGFLLAFPLSYGLKGVRERLLPRGVHIFHALFVLLSFLFLFGLSF